jgi:hypothetical protein
VPKVTPQGQTQHVAQILRIGKHELELQLDRNATGITLEEPVIATATLGRSRNYWWLIIAADVILWKFLR